MLQAAMMDEQLDIVEVLAAIGFICGAKTGWLTMSNVTQEMIERTVSGMAHWAGSGPKGKFCGDCEHYCTVEVGMGRSPRCDKYHQMMNKWGTKRLDSMVPSCKYFEERK